MRKDKKDYNQIQTLETKMEEADHNFLITMQLKNWQFLREDYIKESLKYYGLDLDTWEMNTRSFYLAGEYKDKKDGKVYRIWKPVANINDLLHPEEEYYF